MDVSLPVQTLIKLLLETRGWQAQIVEQSDVASELVEVEKGKGLLKCVDGRASDYSEEHGMRGPKTLGGIYAIASMNGVGDAAGLAAIVDKVRDLGYVPSVHGDEASHSMGCGYFKLWKKGTLPGLKSPDFSGEAGMAAVTDAKGVYETLEGAHYETHVVINLVAGTTLEPNPHNQRFVVDGWVLGELGLDLLQYLSLAVSTVEQLSTTCRSARIIVPSGAAVQA